MMRGIAFLYANNLENLLQGAKLRPGLAKAVAGSLPMYVSLLFRSWRAKLTLVMKKYTAKAILQHTTNRLGGSQFNGMVDAVYIDPTDRLFS